MLVVSHIAPPLFFRFFTSKAKNFKKNEQLTAKLRMIDFLIALLSRSMNQKKHSKFLVKGLFFMASHLNYADSAHF